MREHGLAPGKFAYIPNGVDEGAWERSAEPLPRNAQEALAAFRQRFRFLIGYAGSHGVANALETLLDAALLSGTNQWDSCWSDRDQKRQDCNARGAIGPAQCPLPRASEEGVHSNVLDQMDGLYIGWRRSPLYTFGVSPNKLMDYMMSGKPVVHSIEGANDIVAESGCANHYTTGGSLRRRTWHTTVGGG